MALPVPLTVGSYVPGIFEGAWDAVGAGDTVGISVVFAMALPVPLTVGSYVPGIIVLCRKTMSAKQNY